MKARRFVSVVLVCFILLGIVTPLQADFKINAAEISLLEQDVSNKKETVDSTDPNWLPPEVWLTEEEIAALDPPPITDAEIAADKVRPVEKSHGKAVSGVRTEHHEYE